MKDKVASMICNLVLNIMHASLETITYQLYIFMVLLTSIDDIKCISEGCTVAPEKRIWMKHAWIPSWFTILIIYDGLCALCHTANLLKNSCLSCIRPSYNKNAEMWASIPLPKHFHILLIRIWHASVDLYWHRGTYLTNLLELDPGMYPRLSLPSQLTQQMMCQCRETSREIGGALYRLQETDNVL